MNCPYCNVVLEEDIVQDHFFPKCIFSVKYVVGRRMAPWANNNLVKCCRSCNSIKATHVFWSIDSASDFIKFRREQNGDYRQWLNLKLNDKNLVNLFFIFLQMSYEIRDLKKEIRELKRGESCVKR